MNAADHLAGALTLELGLKVTWAESPESDHIVFRCLNNLAMVAEEDLDRIQDMDTQTRRGLVQRVRRELDPAA